MSDFVIKETIYADSEPESYFMTINPPQYGAPAFVGFTYLDQAKKFKSIQEAEAFLKKKEFEHLKCVVVNASEEAKSLKKGYYLKGNKILFHYVPKAFPLNGKSEFATESVLKDLIDHVRSEIDRQLEEHRANFSWASDLEDQLKKKEEGILKSFGLDY